MSVLVVLSFRCCAKGLTNAISEGAVNSSASVSAIDKGSCCVVLSLCVSSRSAVLVGAELSAQTGITGSQTVAVASLVTAGKGVCGFYLPLIFLVYLGTAKPAIQHDVHWLNLAALVETRNASALAFIAGVVSVHFVAYLLQQRISLCATDSLQQCNLIYKVFMFIAIACSSHTNSHGSSS